MSEFCSFLLQCNFGHSKKICWIRTHTFSVLSSLSLTILVVCLTTTFVNLVSSVSGICSSPLPQQMLIMRTIFQLTPDFSCTRRRTLLAGVGWGLSAGQSSLAPLLWADLRVAKHSAKGSRLEPTPAACQIGGEKKPHLKWYFQIILRRSQTLTFFKYPYFFCKKCK